MTFTSDERAAFVRTWAAVLLRYQQDNGFAGRLLADPWAVLTEAGLPLRPDAAVVVGAVPPDGPDLDRQVELYAAGHAGGTYTFLVPAVPLVVQELGEHELDGVAAGSCAAAALLPPTPGT